jgi:hypothetical protein
MAEWKDLIEKVSEIDRAFPFLENPNPIHSIDAFMNAEISIILLELNKCRSRCLFVADVLRRKENEDRFLKFIQELEEGERAIGASRKARMATVPLTELTPDNFIGDPTLFAQETTRYKEIREAYILFRSWMLSIVQDDLGIRDFRDGGIQGLN